jgi:endonuclease-3
MNKKEKRERLSLIVGKLKEVYPVATCALEYGGDPWRLLVMGRLSAQCTDARVNTVCRELFKEIPTAQKMADAPIEKIEELIKSCGLYHSKAKSLKEASAMLIRDFGGVVPSEMDELLKLSGVGRKIANLLIGDIYGLPAVVCDTHCIRICARLGMYPESLKDPYKIEMILRELIDLKEGPDFCHRIVQFGRDTCTARSPKCSECPLANLCEKRLKEQKRNGAK